MKTQESMIEYVEELTLERDELLEENRTLSDEVDDLRDAIADIDYIIGALKRR